MNTTQAVKKPSNPLPTPQQNTSKPLPALPDLDTWQIAEPVPASLTREKLSTAILAWTEALKPSTDGQYRNAMARLIRFGAAFGIPTGNAKMAQEVYHETLSALPSDLLELAMVRIQREWSWGNRLPMPAEITRTIEEELSQRRVRLTRAQMAMKRLQSQTSSSAQPEKTISREQLDKLMAKFRTTRPDSIVSAQ